MSFQVAPLVGDLDVSGYIGIRCLDEYQSSKFVTSVAASIKKWNQESNSLLKENIASPQIQMIVTQHEHRSDTEKVQSVQRKPFSDSSSLSTNELQNCYLHFSIVPPPHKQTKFNKYDFNLHLYQRSFEKARDWNTQQEKALRKAAERQSRALGEIFQIPRVNVFDDVFLPFLRFLKSPDAFPKEKNKQNQYLSSTRRIMIGFCAIQSFLEFHSDLDNILHQSPSRTHGFNTSPATFLEGVTDSKSAIKFLTVWTALFCHFSFMDPGDRSKSFLQTLFKHYSEYTYDLKNPDMISFSAKPTPGPTAIIRFVGSSFEDHRKPVDVVAYIASFSHLTNNNRVAIDSMQLLLDDADDNNLDFERVKSSGITDPAMLLQALGTSMVTVFPRQASKDSKATTRDTSKIPSKQTSNNGSQNGSARKHSFNTIEVYENHDGFRKSSVNTVEVVHENLDVIENHDSSFRKNSFNTVEAVVHENFDAVESQEALAKDGVEKQSNDDVELHGELLAKDAVVVQKEESSITKTQEVLFINDQAQAQSPEDKKQQQKTTEPKNPPPSKKQTKKLKQQQAELKRQQADQKNRQKQQLGKRIDQDWDGLEGADEFLKSGVAFKDLDISLLSSGDIEAQFLRAKARREQAANQKAKQEAVKIKKKQKRTNRKLSQQSQPVDVAAICDNYFQSSQVKDILRAFSSEEEGKYFQSELMVEKQWIISDVLDSNPQDVAVFIRSRFDTFLRNKWFSMYKLKALSYCDYQDLKLLNIQKSVQDFAQKLSTDLTKGFFTKQNVRRGQVMDKLSQWFSETYPGSSLPDGAQDVPEDDLFLNKMVVEEYSELTPDEASAFLMFYFKPFIRPENQELTLVSEFLEFLTAAGVGQVLDNGPNVLHASVDEQIGSILSNHFVNGGIQSVVIATIVSIYFLAKEHCSLEEEKLVKVLGSDELGNNNDDHLLLVFSAVSAAQFRGRRAIANILNRPTSMRNLINTAADPNVLERAVQRWYEGYKKQILADSKKPFVLKPRSETPNVQSLPDYCSKKYIQVSTPILEDLPDDLKRDLKRQMDIGCLSIKTTFIATHMAKFKLHFWLGEHELVQKMIDDRFDEFAKDYSKHKKSSVQKKTMLRKIVAGLIETKEKDPGLQAAFEFFSSFLENSILAPLGASAKLNPLLSSKAERVELIMRDLESASVKSSDVFPHEIIDVHALMDKVYAPFELISYWQKQAQEQMKFAEVEVKVDWCQPGPLLIKIVDDFIDITQEQPGKTQELVEKMDKWIERDMAVRGLFLKKTNFQAKIKAAVDSLLANPGMGFVTNFNLVEDRITKRVREAVVKSVLPAVQIGFPTCLHRCRQRHRNRPRTLHASRV